ncbi:MAG: diguanylate cyclase response regulator [Deltaproteobacteria bacterium CG1_02_45_11]|nr:MAG: diguanylate cyclase response regulator [Deltaproteobacteria bacterium CG1_02_45_11]
MDAKILIVDDNDSVRGSMHKFIEMSGYNSATASSTEEAVELVKTGDYHVIITDIIMPGMDGLELTELVKKDYDIDVIVITGYSDAYSYEDAINKGASDLIFKPVNLEELLLRLKRVLRERQLRQERTRMLESLQKLAITDGLTQLYNSRHFYNQLEMEVDRSKRYNHLLALLLVDIDHFKEYNDTYGHLQGDEALVRIGQTIKRCLRTIDSAYRYGGEEFTIILPETGGEEAGTVAYRIKDAVEAEKLFPEPGKAVSITVSIGVTQYHPKEKVQAFIQRADKAMYLSKDKGRNMVSALFAEPK